MGRNSRRVQVELNSGDIKDLPENEIKLILRAADELINIGGRNMLVKILKGSRDKKILEYKLDECPAYGFYHSLTMEEILRRVDWMIEKDYIRIDYNGRLPMLVFSEKGWSIEAETFAEEIYQRFCRELKEGRSDIVSEMQEVNRQVVMEVLEKIRAGKNAEFIPMLEEWKKIEVRKVRERISSVQRSLEQKESEPALRLKKAKRENWREIMNLIHKYAEQLCSKYYPAETTDFVCMYYGRQRIQGLVETGRLWILQRDTRIIGAAEIEENRISDLFVLSEKQEENLKQMIQETEKLMKENYESVVFEVMLPDIEVYEKAGYHTIRHEKMFLLNDDAFTWAVMEKKL